MAKKRNPSMNGQHWNNINDIKAYLDPLKYEVNGEAWPKNCKGTEDLYLQLSTSVEKWIL